MNRKETSRFIIVGAGSIESGDLPIKLEPSDFLCAADAGYRALQSVGQFPALLIGDFDSMPEPEGDFEIIRLPVRKDDTDTAFCVKEGFSRGYKHFLIYGALGGMRLSHTIANLELLSMIRSQGGYGELRQGQTRVFLLAAGDEVDFSPEERGHLSLFSLTDEAELSASGLSYPLSHGTLSRSFPLGVSNHFLGEPASLSVHQGEALVILEPEDEQLTFPRQDDMVFSL